MHWVFARLPCPESCQPRTAALRIPPFREMTKRAVHSVRPLASLIALCVVVLQLVSALHFALVPHGFNAGRSGFVHLHRARVAAAERKLGGRVTGSAPNRLDRPGLVAGTAACAPEACPLGFSGSPSTPVAESALCSLIWLPNASSELWQPRIFVDRGRALLSAPKTSPPLPV